MKGMRKFASVADYLKAVPPAPRALLKKVRQTIKAAARSLFGVGAALMKEHEKALTPYKKSKGTIQFTVEKPLPLALVRKLVKARVAQNEARR
jgi:uncharacterized protein YdhG (YjbR/CyaY superfamily)